jgi:hypothetical protein
MLDLFFMIAGRPIMSDGTIGGGTGVTFWATINIRGNLTSSQLKAVVGNLRRIIETQNVADDGTIGDKGQPISGRVVQAVRMSDGKSVPFDAFATVGLRTGGKEPGSG